MLLVVKNMHANYMPLGEPLGQLRMEKELVVLVDDKLCNIMQ